jgi:hypothetical protein
MPISEPYPGVVVREDGTVTNVSTMGSVIRSPDGFDACLANKERFLSDLILMSLCVKPSEQVVAFETTCKFAYSNFNHDRQTKLLFRTVKELKEAMTGEKEDG